MVKGQHDQGVYGRSLGQGLPRMLWVLPYKEVDVRLNSSSSKESLAYLPTCTYVKWYNI